MRSHTLGFNTEATRWVGVYLDTDLQFRVHKCLSLVKARKANDIVSEPRSTNKLEQSLIRRIQVVAVQAVTLYSVELWWPRQKVWCDDY